MRRLPNGLRAVTFLVLTAAAATSLFAQAGGSSNYVVSAIIGPTGNQVQIENDGQLTFPPTPVNTRSTAVVIIQNRGTRVGQVKNVTAFGPAFSTSGLALLPITLNIGATGSETRFSVNFAPPTRSVIGGNLQIEFDTGFISIGLSGQGIGAALRIEQLSSTGEIQPIAANGTFGFPDTPVGQVAVATVRVRNEGEVAATINGITAVGTGYTVFNVVPLPASVAPQSSILFNIRFSPTTVGTLTGRLLIDSLIVNLTGNSLGAALGFSFTASGVTTPATSGATLLFPNTVVGARVTGQLLVTNTGNLPGTVTSVSIVGAGLSVNQVPLPLNLAPGATVTLGIVFAPLSATTITGTLTVDTISFVVRGNGTAPQAIPAYTFGGVGDASSALQQPAVSLKLDGPYPFDLTGRLTLSFRSNSFVDDPSIQFAPGGRTVSFTIPANSTDAIFGQSGQVQFQTGSVAGTIAITPSFAIGAADLTPQQPLVKSVLIPPSTPQLQKVAFGTRTANSLELLVTGYATSRSMSGFTLNFTPAAGKSLQTTSLTLDVAPAFSSWFQSAVSSTVGSQFTASVIINVSGDITAVQAVSVTANNSNGTSAPVSVNFQ